MTRLGGRRARLVVLCLGALLSLGVFGQVSVHPARARAVVTVATREHAQAGAAAPASIAGGEVAFASGLYRELAATSGSVVFSPSSVWDVLAMLLDGAQGTTASQLRSALDLEGLSDSEVVAAAAALRRQLAPLADDPQTEVVTTDELWPQQGSTISPAFVDAVQRGWAAKVHAIDFGNPSQAATTIDAAVSAATHGLIPRLLSPQALMPPPDLVVTDAVYLHASWAYPFDPSKTAPAPFYGAATQRVATMHETAQLGYAQETGYQIVELPYANDQLEMTILLPTANLAPLEAQLESRGLSDLIRGAHATEVNLSLPRFTVSYQQALNADLKALGVTAAFNPATADFAGIGPQHLYLSEVVHQAVVKVAEKGTVAAAATGAVVAPSAVEIPQGVIVTVDRPFLFAITDRATGTALFLGRVETP